MLYQVKVYRKDTNRVQYTTIQANCKEHAKSMILAEYKRNAVKLRYISTIELD